MTSSSRRQEKADSVNILESFSNKIKRSDLAVLNADVQSSADIQFLELAAAMTLINSTAFKNLDRHERIIFCIDNQSDLSALRRGRSGNAAANLLVRAVARATARRQIFWRWVRSANNPADLLTRSVGIERLLLHQDPLVREFARVLKLNDPSVLKRFLSSARAESDKEGEAESTDLSSLTAWYASFFGN